MAQGDLSVTWLGHATFLLESPAGDDILVDPWLEGNPKCPESFESVESDGILVTHGHGDHIGGLFSAARDCDSVPLGDLRFADGDSGGILARTRSTRRSVGGERPRSRGALGVWFVRARRKIPRTERPDSR